ncbi:MULTISPECIES: hypothetical protein [unclassified Duganella]|uniref:hypothetical protein n=1 Tax=unclassified Duganella TaxID=2636909 RepID=UPI00089355D4|nr:MULTISPECIES: hypothetical protein [unclassified Duganella]OEZ63900.1 hypothetical protein DUGA6_04010 [Duganella sp. HH105]OFA06948.1 hypothetical protein DUGA2_02800 [Duganella sp. HH101]
MDRKAPRWSALDLVPVPYESLVNVVQRFAWRNALDSNLMLKCFTATGRERKIEMQSFAYQTFGEVILSVLEADQKTINSNWYSPQFRFCPICLQELYHTSLFQYWHLKTCPIHDVPLETACQSCGAQTPKIKLNECLFLRPYECNACSRACAGAEPDFRGHLLMRERVAMLEARFSPIASWLADNADRRRAIDALQGGGKHPHQHIWCHPEPLLRSLNDRPGHCWPDVETDATDRPPTSHISWRSRAAGGLAKNSSADRKSAPYDVDTSMYTYTLRVLLKRISVKLDIGELALIDKLEHFDVSGSRDAPPELMAMGLMRLQCEGVIGFEDTRMLRPFHFALPGGQNKPYICANGRHAPRIAHYAAYVALFAAWYQVARRNKMEDTWNHFRSSPKANALIFLRSMVWSRKGSEWSQDDIPGSDELWYEGEAVTTAISGLQLFPARWRSAARTPAPWQVCSPVSAG